MNELYTIWNHCILIARVDAVCICINLFVGTM